MNLMMKSIIIHSAYDLRIQNYPLEAFGENEIEITTSVGGVCGTDLHYYQDGGFGSIKLKEPMILGHEVSGYISKLGSNVKKFKEGDLVAISPSRPCNKCKKLLKENINKKGYRLNRVYYTIDSSNINVIIF